MILGHVMFGEINYAPNVSSTPTSILTVGTDFDQVRVDSLYDDSELSFRKRDWTGDTVLQADFEGETLDCGSLGSAAETITHIVLKRKRLDDREWITLEKIPIDSIFDGIYTFIDRMADPSESYEYAIVPLATGAEYNYFIKSINTEMQTCYLYDRDHRYELYYNINFNTFSYNMPNEKIETMGRPYPVVVYNNVLNYAEGGFQCFLYAGEDGEIDIAKEKKWRREIMEFLTNRKPKAIKNFDGTHMMISIVDTPNLTPNARGTYDLEFNFVEIGDMNKQSYLYENGFSDFPTEAGAGLL